MLCTYSNPSQVSPFAQWSSHTRRSSHPQTKCNDTFGIALLRLAALVSSSRNAPYATLHNFRRDSGGGTTDSRMETEELSISGLQRPMLYAPHQGWLRNIKLLATTRNFFNRVTLRPPSWLRPRPLAAQTRTCLATSWCRLSLALPALTALASREPVRGRDSSGVSQPGPWPLPPCLPRPPAAGRRPHPVPLNPAWPSPSSPANRPAALAKPA